jgi:hypothetical protein
MRPETPDYNIITVRTVVYHANVIVGVIETKSKRHYDLQGLVGCVEYRVTPDAQLRRLRFPEHADWIVHSVSSERYRVHFCLIAPGAAE